MAVKKIVQIAYPQSPYTVSSPYGMRGGHLHQGWDSKAKLHAKIRCGLPCKVVHVGYDRTSGNIVTVYYPALKLYCSFAHLNITTVNKGQVLATLSQIGTAGYSGYTIPDNTPAGTHLHMEFGTAVTRYGYIPDNKKINPNSLHWITQSQMKKLK